MFHVIKTARFTMKFIGWRRGSGRYICSIADYRNAGPRKNYGRDCRMPAVFTARRCISLTPSSSREMLCSSMGNYGI